MPQFASLEAAVAAIRRREPPIVDVVLVREWFWEEGARALAEAMKETRTVRKLELASNMLGDGGVKVLADAIKETKTVTSVYLVQNLVGDEGARALAEAIKESGTVTSLNLTLNFVGDEGVKSLAEAIRKSAMSSLTLGLNPIGDAGARAFGKCDYGVQDGEEVGPRGLSHHCQWRSIAGGGHENKQDDHVVRSSMHDARR